MRNFCYLKRLTLRLVLASNKKGDQQTAKGKGAALDKWDQETRDALAAKKKAAPPAALSKADKALVDTQLKKESEIRQRVQSAITDVRTGLSSIESLTRSRAEGLPAYVPPLLAVLLSAVKAPQAKLFQEQAFQTFLVSRLEASDQPHRLLMHRNSVYTRPAPCESAIYASA